MEVLARLARLTDRDVTVLVRAPDDGAATARLGRVLRSILRPGEEPECRIRAVAADVEAPGLGLSKPARERLLCDAEAVVHCAASVSFTLPLAEARRINVGGTRNMLELAAEAPNLDRFVHVSTAYVAGDRDGVCHETECAVGQSPRNSYEQTKLEAEEAVRDSGVPATVVRPSIIVGDSRTGWTPAFNVIYWPLQAFARGMFPTVPCDPSTPVDIVPVDVVADALASFALDDFEEGTIHVVSGDDASNAGELAELAAEAFGAKPPRFVAPGEDPEAEKLAGAYLPYFRNRSVFAPGRGHELGFVAPPLHRYFDAIMDHAKRAEWGRVKVPRWRCAVARV